ncbi:ABC transporter permease [Bacillus sp. FJAT-42376]|uniref:ABC transporter permease n=1 Tax=Bacillus sp. FJAT-42376 TaxID=2014076 RepID=UPI000F50F5D1|nr:ABC transporter permease [Bacillus sp. FJAT-42376]AZB42219.1 ABC transporter permease [Bacillus sp. FJAT-42376]
MRKFWVVMMFTYLNKIKSKSFLITTGISLLLILGISNLQSVMEIFNKNEPKQIAVIDETGKLFEPFRQNAEALDQDLEIKPSSEKEAALKKQVLDGKLDAYVVLKSDEEGLPEGTFYAESVVDSGFAYSLDQSLQQTKVAVGTEKLGVDAARISKLLAPVEMERIALQENAKSEEELNQARGLVYVMLFVIYFSVITYASMIAMEVATEKSSRVMEILISSISPIQQMFAKILGIALVSLTQLAIMIGVGFLAVKDKMAQIDAMSGGVMGISNTSPATIAYCVIFFLLGYFLFATLAAFLGSLVSRIEDVQQMITPMILIVVAGFLIAMFNLGNPDNTFVTVTSFIPFFAPMIMFLRVGMLDVPFWQVGLSIFILAASIYLLAYFGSRVYKGGVLMYGSSSSLKDIKKAISIGKDH